MSNTLSCHSSVSSPLSEHWSAPSQDLHRTAAEAHSALETKREIDTCFTLNTFFILFPFALKAFCYLIRQKTLTTLFFFFVILQPNSFSPLSLSLPVLFLLLLLFRLCVCEILLSRRSSGSHQRATWQPDNARKYSITAHIYV